MSRAAARSEVRAARFLERHERTAKALAAGDITSEHVKCLARVATDHRVELLAEHEDALLDAATELAIDDFAKVARRWARLADDRLASGTFMEQFEQRRLSVSATFQGTVVGEFALDPEGGAVVLAAVDQLSGPDPEDGPDRSRTPSQRRADALVQICRESLQGDTRSGQGRSPVNLNALVDADTLCEGNSAHPASAVCDLDRVGPIGRETMLRLACDTAVSRIVMKGRSEVIDMGRKTRLVTGVQRRALAIRDAGCRFPGCDRPESWCDAQHIRHWGADRGPTNPDNLILLCRRHHTLIHNSRWTIATTAAGEFEFTQPARGP